MDSKEWTLEEIRTALEEHAVEPRKSLSIPIESYERLAKIGPMRVVTIEPGGILQEWEVDEAELMWLMLRSIESSAFVVSVTPLASPRRDEIQKLARDRRRACALV